MWQQLKAWIGGLVLALLLGLAVLAPSDSPANLREDFLSAPSQNITVTERDYYGSVPANDKDCRDFSSHAQAQAFFESQGAADPHRLDGDGDGVACERLP